MIYKTSEKIVQDKEHLKNILDFLLRNDSNDDHIEELTQDNLFYDGLSNNTYFMCFNSEDKQKLKNAYILTLLGKILEYTEPINITFTTFISDNENINNREYFSKIVNYFKKNKQPDILFIVYHVDGLEMEDKVYVLHIGNSLNIDSI